MLLIIIISKTIEFPLEALTVHALPCLIHLFYACLCVPTIITVKLDSFIKKRADYYANRCRSKYNK